jgi:hypothetical protein
MTLDEFLRTLETLIDDRELHDDDPGEGNFGCEDCRKCNHCRFCVGCDSCTDCTYCEESIDCTSCTQSKRCVSCEKVSYCEDCRDCEGSRYLTLCVDCKDCVHCLGCVGLEGAEFYVLNQKRTRKEYFALLRQVQELMQERMEVGWRPPAIGLASDIDDPILARRDAELSAAPWLDPEPAPPPPQRSDFQDPRGRDFEAPRGRDFEDRGRDRPGRAPVDRRFREPAVEPERSRRDAYADEYAEPPRRAREPRRVEHEQFDERRPPARSPVARPLDEADRARRLERERDSWDREPRRRESDYDSPTVRRADSDPRPDLRPEPRVDPRVDARPAARRELDRYDDDRDDDRDDDWDDDWDDRPVTRELGWDDSRERTVARPRRDELREPASPIDDDLLLDEAPREREREASSPWLDEEAQARRRAKRGSLRQAGRPKRKPESESEPSRESTGSGSHRTGSAPARGEGTSTGLRLGRKPKR